MNDLTGGLLLLEQPGKRLFGAWSQTLSHGVLNNSGCKGSSWPSDPLCNFSPSGVTAESESSLAVLLVLQSSGIWGRSPLEVFFTYIWGLVSAATQDWC